jgi:hypothetical protein
MASAPRRPTTAAKPGLAERLYTEMDLAKVLPAKRIFPKIPSAALPLFEHMAGSSMPQASCDVLLGDREEYVPLLRGGAFLVGNRPPTVGFNGTRGGASIGSD